MSADNWTQCPRCRKEREAIFANLEQQVTDSYGKVPVEQFDKARAALEEERLKLDSERHNTWREDWEIDGASKGAVSITYKGGCTVCNLSLYFGVEREIPNI